MGKYLKMADVFGGGLKISSESADGFTYYGLTGSNYCHYANFNGGQKVATYTLHAINSHDELVAEVGRLRQALIDAATSLETIHVRSYGKDSFLDSKHEMRSYAESRAKVARAAIAEQ